MLVFTRCTVHWHSRTRYVLCYKLWRAYRPESGRRNQQGGTVTPGGPVHVTCKDCRKILGRRRNDH